MPQPKCVTCVVFNDNSPNLVGRYEDVPGTCRENAVSKTSKQSRRFDKVSS